MTEIKRWLRNHPRIFKYSLLVREDLRSTYSRDLHRWLMIAPILGVTTGLLITLIAEVILKWIWPPVLQYFLAHKFAMIPGVTIGFIMAGLLMQYLTPDPDEHSTEEIIRSYHEHQGDVQMRPFLPKLLAAIATVGCGGSAALEGPSIYGGGAIGSWMWTKLGRLGLDAQDRRIMLISGAAAGMSAVFRAPLTGIIFALEMPYKDDLAHEALLPSLIASVTSYATMAAFLGAKPLFDFAAGAAYTRADLLWSAVLGLACGLVTMAFDITFRRLRSFCVNATVPHWAKMALGGMLTGACGLAFVSIFKGNLVPIGPNYEAVPQILQQVHSSMELLVFGILKLAATLFSLASGGVSAMFVPLFLTGGSFGTAFAQSIVRSPLLDLYAAVGMAAFIAGGYKTPLTAVVFVAEATGGHAYIIPTLIGAAVAYAVSGEASVSGDQRLHEGVKVAELSKIMVRDVMQKSVISTQGETKLRQFANRVASQYAHSTYPVYEDGRLTGTVSVSSLSKVEPEKWDQMTTSDLMDRHMTCVPPECDMREALRLLTTQRRMHMLLVMSEAGQLQGILTKTDILSAMNTRGTGREKINKMTHESQ
ncbi:MAG TPA: chloride channel protein [Candidatus Dormibacteraeota bacterium]|nr:chloride channel protein [Candidatus Dormibacteraeota bacterium]